MVTIEDIDRAMTELIPIAHPSRPFLCEGSPFGCEVVIIGINPGTKTELKWHWKLPHGCDRRGWIAEFEKDPANSRKKTRPCLEELCRALAPIRCLELNIFPYYTRDVKELRKRPELQDSKFFDFMLSAVKPRMLFVFGDDAIEYLLPALDLKALPKGKFTRRDHREPILDVYADSHFSWYARQKGGLETAKAHAKRIGQMLKKQLDGAVRRNDDVGTRR